MDGPSPLYVPILEEHWRSNSLYGFLEAAGRFNLCNAWEMSRLVDGWAERAFELRPPPQVANLAAFMAWTVTCNVESITPDRQTLRIVMEVAQRDAREVGLGWLVPWLKWCPVCAEEEIHRIVHQHKAVTFCPTHSVRLLTQCAYCAASSPYRVQRHSSLFQCVHCGQPVNSGESALTAMVHRSMREDVASDGHAHVRSRAETILIPGLPDCRQAPVSRLPYGAMAQDLRILYGERIMEHRLRSEASTVLAQYFRFEDKEQAPGTGIVTPNDYESGLLSVLRQVATLGMLAGHSCVTYPVVSDESDYRACPCGVGLRLWLRRVRVKGFQDFACRFSDIQSDVFEASHLGLCLSIAWFASAQADCVADPAVHRSLTQLLDPEILELNMGSMSSEVKNGSVAILDHRFQWFSVRCRHDSQRFLRRRNQLDAIARAPQSDADSILREIPWLMS